jgi:predicted nucleotidyltransferase component of viral defense system
MTPRRYDSPEAFKQSLEHRLRELVPGAMLARKRQVLVFDRLLARLVDEFGSAAVVKGGFALELRLERARSTVDIDLRIAGSPHELLGKLQAAGRRDLGDFMTYEVAPDDDHPEIRTEGMRYDGFRFRATCRLAGKLYGQRFGLDVAFGDPILGEPDAVVTRDLLGFAGIAPPRLPLYPIESHIAEKLHAYTLPRLRPNSRIKDLPDLALLATIRRISARTLRAALLQTFQFRNSHAVPTQIPAPPPTWRTPYAAMARDADLAWATLDDVYLAARAFLDPVLSGDVERFWNPVAWAWSIQTDVSR